jgi:hypothetical protein
MDHGEGTSSRFKSKKKYEKRRHDDNFVVAVERKASRAQGQAGQACTDQGPL